MVTAQQKNDIALDGQSGSWGTCVSDAPVSENLDAQPASGVTHKSAHEQFCASNGKNKRKSSSTPRREKSFAAFFRQFSRDEDGAVTVEFVLWVPVFVFILALTVDATILFISQANMWSVARDTTRFMAVGLYSNGEAETYAAEQLPVWGSDATIVASRDANYVTINLKVPIGDVAPFNVSGIFTDGFLEAELSQRIEPN